MIVAGHRFRGQIVPPTATELLTSLYSPLRVAIMRILIAYDGSAGAEQSLRLADSIDWPADSTLRIAAVIEPTLPFVGAPMAGVFDIPSPEVDAQITAYLQEQVTKAARSLKSADRTVEGIVLRGRPATALVDEAT